MDTITQIATYAMTNDLNKINTISHNLSNVNTVAFKSQKVMSTGFNLQMLNAMNGSGLPNQILDVATMQNSGKIKSTGNVLDLALLSNGYFALESADGSEIYTRNGQFHVDESRRLVNANGLAVKGDDGLIELASTDVRIDNKGVIWEGENQLASLKIVQIENANQLEPLGGGGYSYLGNVSSMEPSDRQVAQKSVESSNVEPMTEMVNLIEVVRSFEMKQKVVSAYDQAVGALIKDLTF